MPNSIAPSQLTQVLVCTDESPDSQGALNVGLALARLSGCRLVLLQVVEFLQDYEFQPRDSMVIPPQVSYDLVTMRETAVRQRLEKVKAEVAQEGLQMEVKVRTSAAISTGIVEEIEETRPQLLITGRHGRTGLERLMVGSVAARVIGQSPVNVLVVPREATLGFKRLLIATDGSSYSQAAWDEALAIARDQGSHLIAASVSQSRRDLPQAVDIVEGLEPLAKAQGVALEPMVLEGRPFEAIVKLARQKEVDLIIMGSHGRTGLMRLLMGSVAERVIGQAPCPVLVVKGQAS